MAPERDDVRELALLGPPGHGLRGDPEDACGRGRTDVVVVFEIVPHGHRLSLPFEGYRPDTPGSLSRAGKERDQASSRRLWILDLSFSGHSVLPLRRVVIRTSSRSSP